MKHKALIVIIVLAAAIRFWQLGDVPPSPDWDEAALGYNAYSVLKTGRDEYGTWFPLSLRSFDDYKPPLYMYLTVPAVALFGLETWAVRLPSAIAGVLAVVGTYVLVLEIFKHQASSIKHQIPNKHQYQKEENSKRFGHLKLGFVWDLGFGIWDLQAIALLSAMLLAISPWHIQFSRIAFEANIGVTINIWAAWAFLRGLTHKELLPVSAFLFGLGFYAYHSERIFVPLLVLLLSWVYRKELLQQKRLVVTAIIIGVLTVAPLLTIFVNPTTVMRLRGTSSLADQTGLLARSVRKLREDQQTGNPLGVVFDNRRIVWASTLLDGYLSHFSLRWLFVTGDNPRHHAPDMGLLYFVELPFLLWGMVTIGRHGGKSAMVLFGWFLLAPVAASPTTELPHAIRTLVFLPTFQIFIAVGIHQFIKKTFGVKHKVLALPVSNPLILFTFLLFALNFIYYLHMYFIHMNREFSQYWQYGYKQAVDYAQNEGARYGKVVVSTKLEQPHMFFLYFLKYDPATYLAEGGTSSGGFAESRNRFGRYEFRPIDWGRESKDGQTLYIGTPIEIPTANLLTINYLDGKDAMRIADR